MHLSSAAIPRGDKATPPTCREHAHAPCALWAAPPALHCTDKSTAIKRRRRVAASGGQVDTLCAVRRATALTPRCSRTGPTFCGRGLEGGSGYSRAKTDPLPGTSTQQPLELAEYGLPLPNKTLPYCEDHHAYFIPTIATLDL
ncbi:hypothetical protein SKAU_G00065570 [Synaphobranchus kaupii]|uniref:Uncharacterized protein n=1 Tax=Synaphobranchus kaupii TaxID=118154 RepID=A0A9Q1JB78_SYNKA|nr:hypothetical protein SKAU_G00065570 [Synaphobranchus kaupii]